MTFPFRKALLPLLLGAIAVPALAAGAKYEYQRATQGLRVTAPGPVSPPVGPSPELPPAVAQPSTAQVKFGSVATRTVERRQVKLTNTGGSPLMMTAAPSVLGDVSLSAGQTSCGGSLAAGQSCETEVLFSPTATGPVNGSLRFSVNLQGSLIDVALQGEGYNPVTLAGSMLPDATVGTAYSFDFNQNLTISTESPPYTEAVTWSVSGTLPAGLSFNTVSGVLSGEPPEAKAATPFTVLASYKGNTAQADFGVAVLAPINERCANGEQTCAVFLQSNAHPYLNVNGPLSLSTKGGISGTGSSYASARTNRSASTGKHYWEMKRTGPGVTYWHAYVCGVAPLSHNLGKLAGYEGGYGFSHPYALQGAVYGCLLDLDGGSLTWTLNGVAQHTVAVTKGPAYAPTPGLHNTDAYTFNFGQSSFVTAPPAGYRLGFY
ncbi:choice-of-anchor D domain-containing protein [Nostoc sp. CHAB 5834]|nr:choice-of-anchor D domain-containing protein [Nostoc sp. CHAB 5834]